MCVRGAFRLSYGGLCRLFVLSADGWVCGEEWWRQVVWLKRGLDRIGRMQALAEGGGDGTGVSPVDGACPKQRRAPHPPNCSFFNTLLPISPSLLLSLSLSRFISLLSSSFLFFSKNALLTKRFTNPGWYIIHDRLLWDWFRQMDSEREGGQEWGRGGCMERMEKEKVKRGVFLRCSSFTKPPHGPRWIFSFLCILRSHTLNAHYTAFMCKRGRRLCEGRAAEDGLWSPCICMHEASLEALWHVWYHHDERFDFHKARQGNGRVCLLQG